MAQPVAQAQPDTQDMVVVHRVFRREFRLLPKLIRATAAGDVKRSTLVGNHAQELLTALHHHHGGEDELVWPRLLERAAPDAELIHRMEAQHHVVADSIKEAERLLPIWQPSAAVDVRNELAVVFDTLSAALDEHLAEEEARILPLAREHLSPAEWEQLGDRGMASIPKSRLLVFLGYILEEATPEERATFLNHVPLPGRVAYRLVGERQYRRESQALRGSIPVQRTGD